MPVQSADGPNVPPVLSTSANPAWVKTPLALFVSITDAPVQINEAGPSRPTIPVMTTALPLAGPAAPLSVRSPTRPVTPEVAAKGAGGQRFAVRLDLGNDQRCRGDARAPPSSR